MLLAGVWSYAVLPTPAGSPCYAASRSCPDLLSTVRNDSLPPSLVDRGVFELRLAIAGEQG